MYNEKQCLSCGNTFTTAGSFIFYCNVCQQTKKIAEQNNQREFERISKSFQYTDSQLEFKAKYDKVVEEIEKERLAATPLKDLFLGTLPIAVIFLGMYWLYKWGGILGLLFLSFLPILLFVWLSLLYQENKGGKKLTKNELDQVIKQRLNE
jgi:hypothetical protein